jgi:hypothetical protein
MFPETLMDYVMLSYAVQYTILSLYIAYTIRSEIQPKALIFRKQNDTYYRLATINIKRSWDCFFFDNKAYMIDWGKIAYHTISYWHHVPRLLYLENEGEPLQIYKGLLTHKLNPESDLTKSIKENAEQPLDISKDHVPSNITSDMQKKLYLVAKEKIVKQLVSASTSFMTSYGMLIIVCVLSIGCGIAIGWIASQYFAPQPTPTA